MTNPVSGSKFFDTTILSYGFRPFFFFGALWAALTVPLWVVSNFVDDFGLLLNVGVDWHIHEMIFGYTSAIITGFLLTAIPSWTGRPVIKGPTLEFLLVVWLAGRFFLLFDWGIGAISIGIDCSFLVLLSLLVWREIIISKNRRNIKIAIILSIFAVTNMGFHAFQYYIEISVDQMTRLGLGLILMLITIIAGRIIPNFTSNWFKKRGLQGVPLFNRYDMVVTLISITSVISWVFFPFETYTGILLLFTAVVNIIRLVRWKFWATVSEPLVLILHIGYGWVVLAFLLMGAAVMLPGRIPSLSAVHAIGTGAIAVMTLAIMTRATLGHTGRALQSDMPTNLIYLMINLAALMRATTPFFPADTHFQLTTSAALLWCLAFMSYCWVYGSYLWRPRLNPN